MDLKHASGKIVSRIRDFGSSVSFTYDEVSAWMKLSSGDDFIWAMDKLSDRMTAEYSLRLELEEDRLIVAISDFNDTNAADKRK